MVVETFSISDFVNYLREVGIYPDLVVIEKYGGIYILDKQAIALYHTGAITFDCDVSVSQYKWAVEKASKGVYVAYQDGVVVIPCKLTVDTECIDLIAKGMDEITNYDLLRYRSSLLYRDKWCQHLVIFRGLMPRFPTFGFGVSPHYSAPYASGLRPHVRGHHESEPTGLGLRPQPSQPSAQARGQETNQTGV